MATDIVTSKNVRRMRNKLESCTVPLSFCGPKTMVHYKVIAEKINHSIYTNDYMPSNGHGYLGYPKKDGCTRFVPILTAIDTLVYYSIVWNIEDDIIIPIDGVFGAWHTKPDKIVLGSPDAAGAVDEYSSSTFNKLAWFTQWRTFGELLSSVLDDAQYGNYVLTTDIANFYDTIDIGRLCDDIRNTVSSSHEIVHLLRFFLQYCDRRTNGYAPSSKGIPQELISDASRTLANFYLYPFDVKFKRLCEGNDVAYLRWADDIVLVGKSQKTLEHTLHEGSRYLLSIGLNFNASKTRHFTRRAYYIYRGLNVLNNLDTVSINGLEKSVRSFERFADDHGGRQDSVFRALISKLHTHTSYRVPYLLNFILERARDYYSVGILDERQMYRFCAICPDPKKAYTDLAQLIMRYPYTSAKATFLESTRKRKKAYSKLGLTNKKMSTIGKKIIDTAGDSEIVTNICAPVFAQALK